MEVYIGLGTNLGDRRAHLRAGIDGLREAGLFPRAVSSVWETEPLGTDHPGWFLNMALAATNDRSPRELLELLLEVELRNGRRRSEPNGPRTLDLDLLLVGNLRIDEPGLRLPHPRMWRRRFVLEPLAEIAPDLINPESGRSVAEERRRLRDIASVRRLGELAPAKDALL